MAAMKAWRATFPSVVAPQRARGQGLSATLRARRRDSSAHLFASRLRSLHVALFPQGVSDASSSRCEPLPRAPGKMDRRGLSRAPTERASRRPSFCSSPRLRRTGARPAPLGPPAGPSPPGMGSLCCTRGQGCQRGQPCPALPAGLAPASARGRPSLSIESRPRTGHAAGTRHVARHAPLLAEVAARGRGAHAAVRFVRAGELWRGRHVAQHRDAGGATVCSEKFLCLRQDVTQGPDVGCAARAAHWHRHANKGKEDARGHCSRSAKLWEAPTRGGMRSGRCVCASAAAAERALPPLGLAKDKPTEPCLVRSRPPARAPHCAGNAFRLVSRGPQQD